MHKVLHKKSPSTVTEWMDPNEETHTNSPSSSTCKLYHSLECTSTLMISCLSVVHTTANLDRSVCLHSLMGKNWGGRVRSTWLFKGLICVASLHRLLGNTFWIIYFLIQVTNSAVYFYSVLDINCTNLNNCQSVSMVIKESPVNSITH